MLDRLDKIEDYLKEFTSSLAGYNHRLLTKILETMLQELRYLRNELRRKANSDQSGLR